MSRIAARFEQLKKSGQKAYVGYVMAGFPAEAESLELGRKLLAAGADLLEIGVPFSDPIADGVVIQKAADSALKAGGSLAMAQRLVSQLRSESQAPLLLMSYLNPVLARGYAAFAEEAKACGADGVIIPDMTPEESGPLKKALAVQGLDLIFLAAPSSTRDRIKKIAKAASGFIYVVSVAGVTGERSAFDARLKSTVALLRQETPMPLAIGFGISSPENALLEAEASPAGRRIVGMRSGSSPEFAVDDRPVTGAKLRLEPGRHRVRVGAGSPAYVVTPLPADAFASVVGRGRSHSPLFEYEIESEASAAP
jgi:tryptophan synthase alpha chain